MYGFDDFYKSTLHTIFLMFWSLLGVNLCIKKLVMSFDKFFCILHSLNGQLLLRYTSHTVPSRAFIIVIIIILLLSFIIATELYCLAIILYF